jgi:hypothetical protein
MDLNALRFVGCVERVLQKLESPLSGIANSVSFNRFSGRNREFLFIFAEVS